MGASRKLQGEIDRVLKKVQEGVDVFDSIWNKVYDTENANQKEKFEADLKKEIKKLQRYRDQIKTWIQSSEIKDKKALVDARKLIEREMERFKVCEKETKTKAFSKEGLGQQPKTDPKEKAKSETRDWINTVVSELENQIDNFEAEVEGLTVKKGKTRPPRLAHLETSITRHKAHIMKLELILRLLDNDELSPEQVNDVKDFLDDYVERNQDDFDEFIEVDDLYSSLPLDKVEALEDLVIIGPPSVVKGAPILGIKSSVLASVPQAAVISSHQQSASVQEPAEETASHDAIPDTASPPRTPTKSSITAATPAVTHAVSAPVNIPPSVGDATGAAANPSPSNMPSSLKEEDMESFPGSRSSPSFSDAGLKGFGRGGVATQQTLSSVPLASSPNTSSLASAADMAKRNMEEKLGSSVGMVQPLASPLSNRMMIPQAAKAGDGTASLDSTSAADASSLSNRAFSPSMQWRPGGETGHIRGRAEIMPDLREKFLQKLHQVQQQSRSNLLGMQSHKQFNSQQPNPLLQQFNPQGSSVSQAGLGIGVQMPGLGNVTLLTLQQQTNSGHPLSNQPTLGSLKESELGLAKADEQQQPILPDDPAADSSSTSGLGKNLMSEDESKPPYTIDSPVGASSGLLTEATQVGRDVDLPPGQLLQANLSSGSLGVIGRRSISDLGAIGDNIAPTSSASHDQIYNLQMLDAAYFKLPQPKDSERARSYTPRHPAMTPPSYPQVQAPIVNNPTFWERLGLESYSTDTLFFSFYYQQNTYQQYLAAKELKKQSWRYHRKYNTWFQRHEEPKVATDEYEQGTYVYFDFHTVNDEQQSGWCQRIKTDFTFEYNYLEDELIV